jgi:hypothetical protein
MYRITEDVKYIKSLDKDTFDKESDFEGFFELDFNGNIYGYYHENPLGDDEKGWALITNWFTSLLRAYLKLESSGYAAVSDIESYNTWIEFKVHSQKLIASIIEAEKADGMLEILTEPFEDYIYGEWRNISIKLMNFKNELVEKASRYLDEVAIINQKLLESRRIQNLYELILEVKNK